MRIHLPNGQMDSLSASSLLHLLLHLTKFVFSSSFPSNLLHGPKEALPCLFYSLSDSFSSVQIDVCRRIGSVYYFVCLLARTQATNKTYIFTRTLKHNLSTSLQKNALLFFHLLCMAQRFNALFNGVEIQHGFDDDVILKKMFPET